MIHINEVIVVEGKYDKERVRKVTDAPIICTHGFELYRSKRIINTLRKMSNERGIIILTDSDSAGFRIRNYIKRCLGKGAKIRNAYIPSVKGKEKRREKPGAEGVLGVEGTDLKILTKILSRLAAASDDKPKEKIDKAEFFSDGFSGKPDSADRRRALAKYFSLPPSMSANALLDMINRVYGANEYHRAVEKLKKE